MTYKKTNAQYGNNNGKKAKLKSAKHPTILPSTLSITGTNYCGTYSFSCGNEVPIYEVNTVHALNQLIGHAKFRNQTYGNVYYRGECKLHSSIKPSLFRKVKKAGKTTERLSKLIQRFIDDQNMNRELKISGNDFDSSRLVVEGMLQHYGIPTRFIDVVDNHWVALWMGLFHSEELKQYNQYYHYTERSVPFVEIAKDEISKNDFQGDYLFQYIILIAVPYSEMLTYNGIKSSDDYIEVDLRQALPSVFLRPHAQHGLVIRRKVHQTTSEETDDYDIASAVIGIAKIRIDKVHEWLGKGELLTQNNLFPPPAFDYGYDLLLSRSDLFDGSEYSVARYV